MLHGAAVIAANGILIPKDWPYDLPKIFSESSHCGKMVFDEQNPVCEGNTLTS
jgi:hypothetical protein